MMRYSYQLFSCPKCKKILFFRFIKILFFIKANTGLGPPLISCSSCGTVINTGNEEWMSMRLPAKVYLLFLTSIYSLFAGFLISIPILGIIARVMAITDKDFPSPIIMFCSSILFGLPLIFLQYLRVEFSMDRTSKQINEPYKTSFLNWQTNYQSLGMAYCIIGIIFWFVFFIIK